MTKLSISSLISLGESLTGSRSRAITDLCYQLGVEQRTLYMWSRFGVPSQHQDLVAQLLSKYQEAAEGGGTVLPQPDARLWRGRPLELTQPYRDLAIALGGLAGLKADLGVSATTIQRWSHGHTVPRVQTRTRIESLCRRYKLVAPTWETK